MTSLRLVALILTLCAGITAAAENDSFTGQITALHHKQILSNLQTAQTIALADFKEPQGTTITRVIRGDDKLFKPGQLWNGSAFPRGPVLIYQRTHDTIGNVSGDLMTTGHYPLDETQRFILREITDIDTGEKTKLLILLEDILKQLKAPSPRP